MKNTIKVFIIIGMILGCWLIFPIVLGSIALRKLNEATSRSELSSWGIVILIFVSLIAGILMLCMKDEDFLESVTTKQPKKDLVLKSLDHIEEMHEMKNKGSLTQAEFDQKKHFMLSQRKVCFNRFYFFEIMLYVLAFVFVGITTLYGFHVYEVYKANPSYYSQDGHWFTFGVFTFNSLMTFLQLILRRSNVYFPLVIFDGMIFALVIYTAIYSMVDLEDGWFIILSIIYLVILLIKLIYQIVLYNSASEKIRRLKPTQVCAILDRLADLHKIGVLTNNEFEEQRQQYARLL